jgi:hypothetical protein
MTLLNSAEIATLLQISSTLIDSNIYNFAKSEFFILTGLKEAETTKTFRKHLATDTSIISLGDENISSITSIKQNNTLLDWENLTDYFLNPDTGNIVLTGSLYGYIEIVYKVSAYTVSDIHNYLLTLLVYRALNIFTPQVTNITQSVSIGRFSKTVNKENSRESLQEEIDRVLIEIKEDDGNMFSFGSLG